MVKSEYPKRKDGFLLRAVVSKDFGMKGSVPTIYYGGVEYRVDGSPTVVVSRSPIVIKSRESLEQAINVIASQGFLPLYCGLVVSEVKYLRIYYPTKDRYGKPKETLGDKILEVDKEYPAK